MQTNKQYELEPAEDDRKLIFKDFLACRLKVLVERMGFSLSKIHEQFGISPPQWMVVALLAESQTEVASTTIKKSTAMDKSRINRTINGLIDKQLILKRRNEEDNRAYNVRLNAKGKRTFAKIEGLLLNWEDDLLVGLTLNELKSLENILTKLETNLLTIETKQNSK